MARRREHLDEDLEALIVREYPRLLKAAYLIVRDPDAAREITQESFARLVERWPRIRRYDNPGAWLRTITVRQALRHRAARAREVPLAESTGSPTIGGRTASPPADRTAFDAVGDRLAVVRALQSIPRGQREVVVLHYVYDLSTDEIAAELGRRPGTVRAQLHQARQRLATLLDEEATHVG
ncbi:MAG TPA: sigma-70 family RNA polymerase sigma factor [Acidimicrobiales bacterium]